MGYSPWGRKESDTEQLSVRVRARARARTHTHTHTHTHTPMVASHSPQLQVTDEG